MSRARIPAPVLVPDLPGLPEQSRILNENFRRLRDALERAMESGRLIGSGQVTLAMLATDARTLAGDVTGDSQDTSVVRIRGKGVDSPGASEDAKLLAYNHANGDFDWVDALRDVLTTRGDLLYRGVSAEVRLAVGAANTLLKSDGTDPGWGTLSALIDGAIGSTRGAVLYRGAATWAKLDPGTSGDFLKTQGAGADPVWATAAAGSSPLTTKGDLWGFDTADARVPVGTDGKVLTADSTAALGVSWQTPAAATPNALLDGSAHSDTVAQAVTRGSLVYGNSTPKWDELVIGGAGKVLRSDGTDPSWQFSRKLPANRGVMTAISLGGTGVIVSNGNVATTMPGGTEADGAETGAGSRFANKYTQAVNTGVTGRASSDVYKAERSPVFYCDFRIVVLNTGASSKMLLQVGFSDSGIGNAKGVVNQARLVFEQTVDTNFQFRLGSGAAANDNDTGVAQDLLWHDVLIYSPDNGVTWKCEIDGVERVSSTTTVPTTTTTMVAHMGFSCIGANASNTPQTNHSYMNVWEGGAP